MKRLLRIVVLLSMCCGVAQQNEFPVWPNGIPRAVENVSYSESNTYDAFNEIRGVTQVSNPTLTPFLADSNETDDTAIIICPGGGYTHLAIEKEGYRVAKWLNALGISAFVLKYRMPTAETMEDKTIGPLQDAQEAVRIVRRNADKWRIDPEKIGILGFSAGGHLASTLSTHYEKPVYTPTDETSAKPDFSVLIYPVISMENGITHEGSRKALLGERPSLQLVEAYSNAKQVTAETPPTFLVHATDDKAVSVENGLEYYLALKKHGVPVEMHVYEDGGHGFGLGVSGTTANWPKNLKSWLLANDYLKSDEVYLFSYFKGNGEDGLHLAYSENGFDWQSLRNDTSFLTPKVGKDRLMRDPCIIKGGDGLYHMVWTVSWTDTGIGYASSKNLIDWSEQKFIPVMANIKGTRNTWAPELTYEPDTEKYIIYWASTVEGRFPETKSKKENGYNHRMYYTTTTDFENFAETQLLYEPGFNVIDATIQLVGDKFVMFLKDETVDPPQKNIKFAFSRQLEGPYSEPSKPITGNYWAEGPTAIQIDGKWIVYFDKYRDHKYGGVMTTDWKQWTDISDQIHFPEGTRHGTVLKVPRSLLKQLE